MSGKFAAFVLVLAVVFLSSAYGYGPEVRERMMVRNLAPVRLDDSVRPVIARDVVPGAGIFEYSEGPFGFGWPVVAVNGPYNVAMLDTGGCLLSHSRIREGGWPLWDSVFSVAESVNQPMFETHNIASSPVSQKVCITWVRTDTSPMLGYYRVSVDGGATWGPVQVLTWPPAYGGDTLTSYHVSSLYPFYDSIDHLHVVAAVHPVVHDTAFIMPAGIWHWCPGWSPNWMLLSQAGCAPEHLAAPVGYNALYACRPSGSCTPGGGFLAVWEQFDSANVEPLTNLLRAGVYASYFDDRGVYDTRIITSRDECSYRFPVVTAYPGDHDDTALVQYEIDQVAGFYPLGQGVYTMNPIVVRHLELGWYIYPGRVDTVGGTTYDLQACGPVHPTVSVAPGYGVQPLWTYSAMPRPFPDLNARFNFYDFSVHCWNWTDPDYMQSGVNTYPYQAAAGCLASEPVSGVAVISAYSPPILPHVPVEETPSAEVRTPNVGPTIIRGVLVLGVVLGTRSELPGNSVMSRAALLDISGRKVMELHAGANDVSRLPPGIYFVRERLAVGGERSAVRVRKVILTE
jgi:hypothetical protein